MRKRGRTINGRRVAKRRRVPKKQYKGRIANMVELKFHDLDIDDADIAAGGTIAQVTCNEIAQGTTESTRIGRKLKIQSIGWRYHMTLGTTGTATATSDIVRIMLYLDKQANGATATVTGILESADYQSFNNLANKSRFTILMDRTYAFSAPAGSGRGSTDTLSYGEHTIEDSYWKKCNIPIEYDNSFTTGVIGTIRSNNIGVMTLSHSGNVQFLSKMRLRFSDG